VDRPAVRVEGLAEGGDGRQRRQVERLELHPGPGHCGGNTFGGGLALSLVAHGQNDIGARRGQPPTDPESHAVAAAGDHGALTGQVREG